MAFYNANVKNIIVSDMNENGVKDVAEKINGTAITATAAELNYVDGVTSAIQTQMDTKASTDDATALAIALG